MGHMGVTLTSAHVQSFGACLCPALSPCVISGKSSGLLDLSFPACHVAGKLSKTPSFYSTLHRMHKVAPCPPLRALPLQSLHVGSVLFTAVSPA